MYEIKGLNEKVSALEREIDILDKQLDKLIEDKKTIERILYNTYELGEDPDLEMEPVLKRHTVLDELRSVNNIYSMFAFIGYTLATGAVFIVSMYVGDPTITGITGGFFGVPAVSILTKGAMNFIGIFKRK